MIRGNLWNDARASTRSALLFVAERSTLAQLAEAVEMTTVSPSGTRSDLDVHRVGV